MSAFGGKADVADTAATSENDPTRTLPLSMLESRGSVRATRVLAWADTIGVFDQWGRHEKAGIHQSCWWSGGGLASYSSCAELSIALHHNGGAFRRRGHF
jgi:hypothetical protein